MPIDRISHLVAPTPGEMPTRRRSFYRTFVQFLCSNLGLVLVVIAYTIGGAFLFILLEQYIELQNCQQGSLKENVSISNLSETMFNYVSISTENDSVVYGQIATYLNSFSSDVYDREDEFRYTGQDCESASRWTFPSALLFTITIVTSIGYGHVTPVSWEGQITCICYALIGIPIFLLCLANISSILGDMFRFLYSTFLHFMCCCCRSYMRNRRRKRQPRDGKSSGRHRLDYVGKASIDPSWPEANETHDGDQMSDGEEEIDENYDEELEDVWNRMESRVPIIVVVLIIIGYISVGALMFSRFEDWTMEQSVYFCYITLSTIGFGDYVPGITSSSTNGLRFLAASLYIIIGLAVLAMCIDLIKESIVDKIEWIAHKFGLVGEDEYLIDDGQMRYANFHYSQRSLDEKNNPYEAPPAYDATTVDRGWLKDVRDKNEPTRQQVSTNDGKH